MARCVAAVTAATANSPRLQPNGEPRYCHPAGDGCLRTASFRGNDGTAWCWQHGRNFNVVRQHGPMQRINNRPEVDHGR